MDWSEVMSRGEEPMFLMSLEWMDLPCHELQWDGMRRLDRSGLEGVPEIDLRHFVFEILSVSKWGCQVGS